MPCPFFFCFTALILPIRERFSICSLCNNYHVITLLHATKTFDNEGNNKLEETPLVEKLIIRPEEFQYLIDNKNYMNQANNPGSASI